MADDHLIKQQRTLEKIANDDPAIHMLCIGNNSSDCYYSKLGKAVATNSHITSLTLGYIRDDIALDTTNRAFFDGLRQNSSIRGLLLTSGYNNRPITGPVIQEVLKVYREKRSITYLCIDHYNLTMNGAEDVIITSLRRFSNIRHIRLNFCHISDELLLLMVEAVRGHSSLEELNIENNRIGNVGCRALADLLEDPNSNLQSLLLSRGSDNPIGNEGAMAIINSLRNNTKLKELQLYHRSLGPLYNNFSEVLCNTSSINSIHSSNHALEKLSISTRNPPLDTLLHLNGGTNKSHVAIRKILHYHPNIDMESLYAWDSKDDRTLKSLPYIVSWFGRASDAMEDDDDSASVERRKLSAIYQFAKDMPILFIPINADDKKRKRTESVGDRSLETA